MKKLDAKKLAQYFFNTHKKSSHLDSLVVCAILDHPDSSPTDIQEHIFGVRRGGSVDKSLSRLRKLGLIDLVEPVNPSPTLRRQVVWTNTGKKWLKAMA